MDLLISSVISLLSFMLVLGLVVFVHEWGHFAAARSCGVAVDTFSIGFGQAIATWRDKAGVIWKIGSLPLGGYVKFRGDANAASMPGQDAPEDPQSLARARREGLFHAQSVPVRAFVIASGPLANFIFATLIFAGFFWALGRDVTDARALSPRVDVVFQDSAAARAGLEPGDVILAINGQSTPTFGAVQDVVQVSPGKPLSLEVAREAGRVSLTATPEPDTRLSATGVERVVGVLGFRPRALESERVIQRYGPISALWEGAKETWSAIANTVGYIANIFQGLASAQHFAGLIGIFDQTSKVATASMQVEEASIPERATATISMLLQWMAFLSVAVGFANLLPIPVLDGGHLAFLAVEAVRGKPLSARIQQFGYQAGFAMLICLFLFATWNDVQRLTGLQ